MFIPRFSKDYKASKLVVSIYKYPVYIPKRILINTHIVMIMMCVTCRLMYASCIYDRWPMYSTYQHQTQQKIPERTHHDQASSYKKFCKGRATDCINSEGYQEKLFSTFSSTFFIILCFYHLLEYCCSIALQCINKCNSNNVMLPFPVFYLKFYLTAISVLLNRILNQPASVKSWLKLL